jgi:hypothetical protein
VLLKNIINGRRRMVMDKNKVKIELYKSKVMAKFSHYVSGNLYYKVALSDGIYQFPLPTVETKIHDGSKLDPDIQLSTDLGTTSFYDEMKGSELNRWIGKSIDSGDFIKIEEL